MSVLEVEHLGMIGDSSRALYELVGDALERRDLGQRQDIG
jgi:hypothetical protein